MIRAVVFCILMTVGLAAGVASRFAALLVYVWFGLFRPQEWVWFDLAPYRLSMVLGGLLVIPCLLTGILPNLTHPLSLGSILFLLCALGAQPAAADPALGWYWIGFLAKLVLVCLLAITLLSSRRRFVWMLAVISGSLAYYTAKAGVVTLVGGGLRFAYGQAGAFVDSNGYALSAVMILPFLLAVAQNLNRDSVIARWLRVGFLVAVPATALTVISTFSRAGFLAMVAAAATYVALQRRRLALSLALLAAVLVGLLLVPLPTGYFNRIDTIRTYEQIGEDSALSRLHFWEVALAMAQSHPMGIGLRNFEATYDRYDFLNGRFGRERSVHSSHLQALAETGYIGFAVWVGLFAIAFRKAFLVRRRSREPVLTQEWREFLFTTSNALIVSMVGFVIGGAFIALALNDLTWLTFALVAALDRLSLKALADAPSAAEMIREPPSAAHQDLEGMPM